MIDKKKLCVIIPTHWSARMGGSKYQAKCLIDILVPMSQFDIYYLTRRQDLSFRPEEFKIIRISGAKGISRYGFFFDYFRLIRLLREINPDVIYQRVGCAYTGIAAHYTQQNNCKMIWHIASDNDVLPFQEQSYLRSIFRRIDKKILEYGIMHCHRIVAQTNQQAEYLKTHYGRTPTAIIRNFHPLPLESMKKTKPVKIIWIANFKRLKQPECFIKLAKDLINIGEKVECIMIGSPAHWAPNWQSSLENQINEIENLSYLGPCSIEEVNSILARAHIFVSTSLYEGFANTFIQAWMRKVPVVSLHCNPDGVFDRHTVGFYSGTYRGMLESVVWLAKNHTLRNEIGEKAQAYAFEKHSEKNVTHLIEILKS